MLLRETMARQALRNGALIRVQDSEEALDAVNAIAPEHLELQVSNAEAMLPRVIAGAVFVGPFTPEPVGDYWAGPSHTLPTGVAAMFASALTANDFVKSISLIEYTPELLRQSAEHIVRLAQIEGLDAHARSVTIRQSD